MASLRLKISELKVEGTDFDIVVQAQKFEEAIDELREKSEQEVAQFRADLETTYKGRVRQRVWCVWLVGGVCGHCHPSPSPQGCWWLCVCFAPSTLVTISSLFYVYQPWAD